MAANLTMPCTGLLTHLRPTVTCENAEIHLLFFYTKIAKKRQKIQISVFRFLFIYI